MKQLGNAGRARQQRCQQAQSVNDLRGGRPSSDRHGQSGEDKEDADTSEEEHQDHGAGLFNRTPRPPVEVVALSEMSSIPAVSRAATSFIRESTLPRTTPSLASIRWMVGSERSDNSASLRWSMPRRARAARSWAPVIIETYLMESLFCFCGQSILMFQALISWSEYAVFGYRPSNEKVQ